MRVNALESAFNNYRSGSQWPNGTSDNDISLLFDKGTWVEWPGYEAKSFARFWRNPDTSNGDLWWEPGRFGSIDEWKPKKATGWFLFDFLRQLKQLECDLRAMRTPLVIPFEDHWDGDRGTTDNGMIILMDKSGTVRYEIQGGMIMSEWDAFQVNLRLGYMFNDGPAKAGDWRCDAITRVKAGTKPYGSQGPKWKTDGLFRPEHMRSMSNQEMRLVVFNNAWGPEATAASPGWVEHKGTKQPYGLTANPPIYTPRGNDPRMIPCFQGYYLDISDAQIERWIEETNKPDYLKESCRWFARNMRGWKTDDKRLANPKVAFRSSEGGSWSALMESTGWVNPTEKKKWAEVGIATEADARTLGEGIFGYGEVKAVS